jgi:hypothetical protein
MQSDYEIVIFHVTHEGDLYTATSPQLAGVCVVHRDRDRIIEDMPNIVRLWYRRNRGLEVEPFSGTLRDIDGMSAVPMFTLPAAIAAQALAR